MYIDDISQWSAGESLFECIAEFQGTLTERNAVHCIPSIHEGVKMCREKKFNFYFSVAIKWFFFHFDKEYQSFQLKKNSVRIIEMIVLVGQLYEDSSFKNRSSGVYLNREFSIALLPEGGQLCDWG